MDRSQTWIEDRASAALKYLAETDEEDASLRMEMVKAERAYKLKIDAVFLVSQGSIEQRKAESRSSPEAETAFSAFASSSLEFHKVHNKRMSQRDALEWCRSLNANRRQGA